MCDSCRMSLALYVDLFAIVWRLYFFLKFPPPKMYQFRVLTVKQTRAVFGALQIANKKNAEYI